MNPFLTILAPVLTAIVGLYMFTSLLTALAYAGIIGLFMMYAVRRHDKHHNENMYDDRLTTERVDQSREWLVSKWQDEE